MRNLVLFLFLLSMVASAAACAEHHKGGVHIWIHHHDKDHKDHHKGEK